MLSAASRLFSTSSRIDVYSDLPGFSKPARRQVEGLKNRCAGAVSRAAWARLHVRFGAPVEPAQAHPQSACFQRRTPPPSSASSGSSSTPYSPRYPLHLALAALSRSAIFSRRILKSRKRVSEQGKGASARQAFRL